jgi:hypothetical protein
MSSVVFGISGITGSLLGGVIFQGFGGAVLFRGSALMVLIGLGLFLAAGGMLRARSAGEGPPG